VGDREVNAGSLGSPRSNLAQLPVSHACAGRDAAKAAAPETDFAAVQPVEERADPKRSDIRAIIKRSIKEEMA
jgi:hypothetical protein